MSHENRQSAPQYGPLPAIAVVIGLLLIVGSWIWPMFAGGRRAWSDSDAAQYQLAAAQFHDLTYQYGAAVQRAEQSGPDVGDNRASPKTAAEAKSAQRYAEVKDLANKLAEVKERYEGLSMKLHQAQTGGADTARVLFWGGIVAVVIGALGIYADRPGTN